MQGFSKNYIRKRREDPIIKDDYDREVENTARKSQLIEARSYNEFAGKKETLLYIKRSYLIIGLSFVVSGLTYPLAVRFVKKVFKFKAAFNVNFAALPIILNVNALVVGCAQGFYNSWEITQNYKFKGKATIL